MSVYFRIFIDEGHLCSQPLWGQIVELCRSAAAIESRAVGSVNRRENGIESRREDINFTPGPLILRMNESGAGDDMIAPEDDEASATPSSTPQGQRMGAEPAGLSH
ncbi:uncharacterized protein LOC127862736 [Dreissena polymorpha]|uniref:uncharacterized protein LOC127862736 n=1 Tax=Dreissena polymorpha TaxID=45954 RepID=UPI002264C669|nr:uncharacterized protein LOC127862736 [Dreissena polymorpha]